MLYYIHYNNNAIYLKIAHSIKHDIRLGCNITEGEDIENVIKNL